MTFGRWALVAACVASTGCEVIQSEVAVRFANEHHCPLEKVEVRDVGAGAYRASGCRKSQTYICQAGEHTTVSCTRDE